MSTVSSSTRVEDFFVDPVEDAAAQSDPGRVVEMGMGSNGPLVDRAYSEALPFQYARELVKNGFEAGATYIEVGIDWEQVSISNGSVYRLRYRDNGCGMSDDELETYFNHISSGSKMLDAHGNFGVGAKISLLPWNHRGLIVASWQDGDGSMIRLCKASNGNYGLQKWAVPVDDEFDTERVVWHKVIDAFEEYAPSWVVDLDGDYTGSGTVIVCLGNTGSEDTILGPDAKGTVKAHTLALNTRFFEIPDGVTVRCQELANNDKSNWPKQYVPVSKEHPNGINNRLIRGARHYLDRFTPEMHRGTVQLAGARAHWWLMDDTAPAASGRTTVRQNINSYAMHNGFIGALYDNELYDIATGTPEARQRYHAFGVIREPVWARLTIVVEPDKWGESDGAPGVFPNGARSHLYHSATPTSELPWPEWGLEFMLKLPAPIREAIDKAAIANQKVDLSDKLKALLPRMRQRIFRPAADGGERVALNRSGGLGRRSKRRRTRDTEGRHDKANGADRNLAATTDPKGDTAAVPFNPRIDVPLIEWVGADDMSSRERAAEYVRNQNTILINSEFWLFKQEFEHWASMYASIQGSERQIMDIIREVYGLALASRVMHAWTLEGKPGWEDEDQFDKLLSPEALTLACLGIAHADAQIAPKIGGTLGAAARGRKKAG